MNHLTIDETIKINDIDLLEYFSNIEIRKDKYVINNVIFGGVSGQLVIRLHMDNLNKMIFTPICYLKLMPVLHINSNKQFMEIKHTITQYLNNTYKKKNNIYYNKHYLLKTHISKDNYCVVIKERKL